MISLDKEGRILVHSIRSGEFLKEIRVNLIKEEKPRFLEYSSDGLLVILTSQNRLIVAR